VRRVPILVWEPIDGCAVYCVGVWIAVSVVHAGGETVDKVYGVACDHSVVRQVHVVAPFDLKIADFGGAVSAYYLVTSKFIQIRVVLTRFWCGCDDFARRDGADLWGGH